MSISRWLVVVVLALAALHVYAYWSFALYVKESLAWDHARKCAAGLPPVDKKPCERQNK